MLGKVLILCTGNSCRSIMAEALINKYLPDIEVKSSGVKASGAVNPLAKEVLKENGIWNDSYHSKTLEELNEYDFNLVVTLCDNAKESCPLYPKQTKVIHLGFEDPDGKSKDQFINILKLMKTHLLPLVEKELQQQKLINQHLELEN